MEESAAEKLRGHIFELRDARRPKPEVEVGTWVKVGCRNERFWCRVTVVRGDGSLVGIVDNDLVYSSWRRGDEIVFQQCHVRLEVSRGSKDLTELTRAPNIWGGHATCKSEPCCTAGSTTVHRPSAPTRHCTVRPRLR